jgi:tetratricopeptide (TPR) repeat protein
LYYEQAVTQQEDARLVQGTALTEEAEALYPAYILAGNSSIANGNHKRAIRMYRKADSLLLLPAATEKTYAAIYNKKNYLYTLLAATLVEAGSQLGGKEGYDLLTEATLVEKTLLANYKAATPPQEWAKTQCQLGTIWHLQGDMTAATAGDSLYMLSIDAFNGALTVYTQKDFPIDWARMQLNLGVVLSKLGAIKEAIGSFRSAMGIFTLVKNPRDWASTAYHLGNMLQCQAGKAKDPEATQLFTESVKAYKQALEVYNDKTTPEEWGWAQHNLGVSLFEQGRRLGERELLSQAAAAFRQALTIQTKDCFPAAWASTQYNLGTALWEENSRAAGDNVALLTAAATAYESALAFYTPKDHPEQWFNVQNGLGLLYEQQKEWTAAIQHFENLREIEPMYVAQKVNDLKRKAGR